ncbi:hypothetical protein BDR03DRAFT_1000373 [Suillus americanus]|nr:hypothetical protein BDR03DRAFT_1000373 [Suillus americanus]
MSASVGQTPNIVAEVTTETEKIGPFFDSANVYGASNQLSSRLIPHATFQCRRQYKNSDRGYLRYSPAVLVREHARSTTRQAMDTTSMRLWKQSTVPPILLPRVAASSYQNEDDVFEMNWEQVFFGYKYANLCSIKQKQNYDPGN